MVSDDPMAAAPTGNGHRPDELDSLCEKLGSGDSQAVRQVFDDYSTQLVRLASRNISPALAKRFDGEDVVQSAFRTFFRRLQAGTLTIRHTEHLWRLLVTITLCKTKSYARRHRADRRNVATERPAVDEQQFGPVSASEEDLLALQEEIDLVLEGLPPHTTEIVSGRLAGKGKTEIAKELGLTRQTVHRLLRLVESRLTERLDHLSTPMTKPDGSEI